MKRYSFAPFVGRLLIAVTILVAFFAEVKCQSLLYEVSGKGLVNPIYIYGTIHALPQSDFFIDDIVLEKFNQAEKVIFEIDMSSPTMMYEVQSAMVMKENTIADFITEQEYERIKSFFIDSLQIPFEMISRVKPLLMSSFMLPKIIGEQAASYEAFFLQKAFETGKPMAGIETVAEQMGYMDSISIDKQAEILIESIDDFQTSRKEFQNLVTVYKTRDVEKVYQVMMDASEEYKEFGDYLIDQRNENWIPRLIDLANQNLCFVAVGCGHLGGDKGILNLLKKRGFEVKPIE